MRIRTIKPEFFLHDGLFELEKETSLPIRVAFAGLWCAADREGRFKWEPRRLGAQILPYDGIEFSRVLHALTTRGYIVHYACGGVLYGFIPSFTRHQVINTRERSSILPEPPKSACISDFDASATREAPVIHASTTRDCNAQGEGNREQGTGKGIPLKPPTGGVDEGEDKALARAQRLGRARPALHYLNEKTGRQFRDIEVNLTIIAARMEEVHWDFDGIKLMIDRQVARWKGTPQEEYLRPETLFGKSKFDSYWSARELPVNTGEQNGNHREPDGAADRNRYLYK